MFYNLLSGKSNPVLCTIWGRWIWANCAFSSAGGQISAGDVNFPLISCWMASIVSSQPIFFSHNFSKHWGFRGSCMTGILIIGYSVLMNNMDILHTEGLLFQKGQKYSPFVLSFKLLNCCRYLSRYLRLKIHHIFQWYHWEFLFNTPFPYHLNGLKAVQWLR